MKMTLIKKGNKREVTMSAECRRCGSIFHAPLSELTISCVGDYLSPTTYMTETCTECGSGGLSFRTVIIADTVEDVTKDKGLVFK